jgi:hypothetical protein
MLTYAYNLLYAIYLDANYESSEIPEKILTNNLYGIEIDERAAELAAFSLTMKAMKGNPLDDGNNRRRFFRNPVEPNICRLESVVFGKDVIELYKSQFGMTSFSKEVVETLKQFDEANNFGSLIQPKVKDVTHVLYELSILKERNKSKLGSADELSKEEKVLVGTSNFNNIIKALSQADILSQKYHVVVANPPYMSSKGMNPRLAKWAKDNYPDSKSDLFSMFIERDLALTLKYGYSAMINMQSWMFLSSFETLRLKLLRHSTITSMAHLGTRAFDSISGEVVSTTAYILQNCVDAKYKGSYARLVNGKNEAEKETELLEIISNSEAVNFHTASADDFSKIPGSPLAYWLSEHEFNIITSEEPLSSVSDARVGLQTSDNDRFLRNWHEVSQGRSFHGAYDLCSAKESGAKWFPCNKGGEFRKWYGNQSYYVNWEDDGKEVRFLSDPNAEKRTYVRNDSYYFRDSVSWCDITTEENSFRRYPPGFIHDAVGHSEFAGDDSWKLCLMAYCNNKFSTKLARLINPTIHFHIGYYQKLPYAKKVWDDESEKRTSTLVEIAKKDWDGYETSWNFQKSPFLDNDRKSNNLADNYERLRTSWSAMIKYTKCLEEQNNSQFIDMYELNNELSPELSLNKITLSCNPAYRYGKKTSELEGVKRLRSDTVREYISYAVGCMLGRYSLDKEGLILVNQGDTLKDFLQQVRAPSFMPDGDNVIPLIDLDGNWFEDDISERFKKFLKVTFGEECFSENLTFIEESIGKDIKKFFLKDFYADHMKRYKKRPIYWLFSSPKGSFNALIYMHRYRPDTVSVVLNDYLREFRTKLEAKKISYEQIGISLSASQGEKTNAIKNIEKINKAIDEINDYERDVLYPLASQNIEIDLDDGVKHNYPLLGKALKKVTGLS